MLSLQLGRMFTFFGKWSAAFEICIFAGAFEVVQVAVDVQLHLWSVCVSWSAGSCRMKPYQGYCIFSRLLINFTSCLVFSLLVFCRICCVWDKQNKKNCTIDNKFVHRESLHKMYQSDIYIEMESVTDWGCMSDSWCNCLKVKAQNHTPSGP